MVGMQAVPPTLRAKVITRLATAALAAALLATPSIAEPRYGLSVFGELKYPADFKNFEYVNPDAPKGGRLAMVGSGGTKTFDSFNNFLIKGDRAQGLEYLYDSLMTRALDEPDAVYGLVASSADVAPDKMSVVFKLRPEAKFADGTPVTAEDVVFSFDALKGLKEKGRPEVTIPLRDVVKAEALDPQTVRYTFQGNLIRDLPLVVAELPILPKAYYAKHPLDLTSLDKPVASGPYEIGDFRPGTFVTYKRRPDYWAKDLAGQSRPLQFRRAALRLLPRPHRRVGGPEVRQYRFPRGVHVDRLVDGLRHSFGEGRPASTPRAARPAPIRRAGLLHQHAPRALQGQTRARGARSRL